MKKTLALLLSLIMVVTFMPTMAFAEENSLTPGDGKYMVETQKNPEGGTIGQSGSQDGPNTHNGCIQYLYNNEEAVTITITPNADPQFELNSIQVIKAYVSGGFVEETYYREPNVEDGQKVFGDLNVTEEDGVYSFTVSSEGSTVEDIAIFAEFFNADNDVKKEVEAERYAYPETNLHDNLATEIYNKFFATEHTGYFNDLTALKNALSVDRNENLGIADHGQYNYSLTLGETGFTATGIVDVLENATDVVLLCNRDDVEPLTQIVSGEDGTSCRRVIFEYNWKGNVEVYGNGVSVEWQYNNFDQQMIGTVSQEISSLDGGLNFTLFVHQPVGSEGDGEAEQMKAAVESGNFAFTPAGENDDAKKQDIKTKLASELFNTYFNSDNSNTKDKLIAARGYFLNKDDVSDFLDVDDEEKTDANNGNLKYYEFTLELLTEDPSVKAEGRVYVIEQNQIMISSGNTRVLATLTEVEDKINDCTAEILFAREQDPASEQHGEALPITVCGNGAKVARALEVSWDRVVYQVELNNKKFYLNICNTEGKKQPGENELLLSYTVYGERVVNEGGVIEEPGGTVSLKVDETSVSDKDIDSVDIDSETKIQTLHTTIVENSFTSVTFTIDADNGYDAYYSVGDTAPTKVNENSFTITKSDLETGNSLKKIIIDFREAAEEDFTYAVVKHTFHGLQDVQVSINGSRVNNANGKASTDGTYTSPVRYATQYKKISEGEDDLKNGYVRFDFAFEEELEAIKINNGNGGDDSVVTKEGGFFTDDADRLAHYYDFHYHYTVDVPVSITGIYTVETTLSVRNEEGILISGFSWNSEGQDPYSVPEDALDGGKIRLISAVYKGEKLEYKLKNEVTGLLETRTIEKNEIIYDATRPDAVINNHLVPGSPFTWQNKVVAEEGDEDAEFGFRNVEPYEFGTHGDTSFPAGTEVTVALAPDYGKQLVEFKPVGVEFTAIGIDPIAGEDVSTYTFTVPNGRFHIGAKFRGVGNETVFDNAVVNDAHLAGITDETMPVDSGTLRMEVTSPEVEVENAIATVDISMWNVVYNGTQEARDNDWNDPVPQLQDGAKATVELDVNIPEGVENVSVIREHDGIETTLDASINEDGKVIFETDKFSTYAIVAADHAHDYYDRWSWDASNHWHSCKHRGCEARRDEGAHIGEATCSKAARCEVCGHKFYAPHELIYVEATPATATTNGNYEYWYCVECHKHFKDEAGTVEYKAYGWIIPATGTGSADEAKFGVAKTDALSVCDALLEANKDSEYPYIAKLVDAAKKNINATQYDRSKSFNDNVAVLNTIVDNLKKDVQLQKALDEQSSAKAAKVKAVKVTQKALKTYKTHTIKVAFKRAKADGKKITTYQIYRKTGKNGTYKKIKTLTSKKSTITYTNKNLKKGKKYYYKVRGVVTLANGSKAYTKFSTAKSIKCK